MSQERILEALIHQYKHPLEMTPQQIDAFSTLEFSSRRHYFLSADETGVHLTMREAQIMVLSIMGNTAKEVSRRLGISYRTVEYYIENIKRKLDCNSKRDAISRLLASQFLANILGT